MFSLAGKARGPKKTSILIVEDNIPLASCLEMLLESQGYEVSRTADGTGGLQSIRLMDFDVILCDLVMPGLCGDQLHLEVRRLKPHLCDRFIFMSGQPKDPNGPGMVSGGDRPVLRKPFALGDLLDAIQAVLRTNLSQPVAVGA